MRYSMLLGALGAAGALASPVEKREYTTEWTIVTVTTTVTGPAPTATYAPIQAVQVSDSVSNAPEPEPQTQPPAPVKPVEPTTSIKVPVAPTTTKAPAPVEPTSTAAPTTSSIAPSSTTAPAAAPTGYQADVLYNHNVHRSNHSANSLEWSSDLQASAQALAAACVYQHDTSINGGGYGQNIGYGVGSSDIGVMISNLMYNNEMGYFTDMYGSANPDMTNFDLWGHFSQIVWKGTTEVGCATVVCPSLGNVDSSSSVPFTVCNYSPPGNYDGEYADNVLAPLGHAMYSA
ncbi:hypothetical protein FE257_000725 [Aspergillus nanangensis]|uniref:SCP domain-containing protein n=1 Tax=Aspergillus nanangensis TaxID=2582783 RepID=A0AAD4GQ48_ASPNN|nr:hypothetical protein FE257_000725 [Aspergillus nanangensis]